MFKLRYRLRHGGLSDAELQGRLPHAAASRHCPKDVKITQLDAPADLLFPIDFCGHRKFPRSGKRKRDYRLSSGLLKIRSSPLNVAAKPLPLESRKGVTPTGRREEKEGAHEGR